MKEKLRKNYKFIIAIAVVLIACSVHFPYYIDAPGGISDISKKIDIDGYSTKGSFNLTYVKEYRATLPTLIISRFNSDWDVIKKSDILLDTEDDKSYFLRDKLLMDESVSNAISVAYTKANKKIKVIDNKLTILYIVEDAKTNLSVGDEIVKVNNKKVNNKEDITNIINKFNIGDKITITIKNNNKEYNKYAYVIEEANKKIIGMLLCNVNEYETNPKVGISIDKNESGPSGGLIMALSIYNSLVKEDITKGLIIVGTGTIDLDGNVGSIGGVEYKLKSAVKENADLFIVPNDKNLEEALKLKKKYNYKIDIVGVSTFNDIVDYLNNIK